MLKLVRSFVEVSRVLRANARDKPYPARVAKAVSSEKQGRWSSPAGSR